MKAIVTLFAAVVLTLTLTACATTSTGGTKAKCPACGYEFTTPLE